MRFNYCNLILLLLLCTFLSACSKSIVFDKQAIWHPSKQAMQEIMQCHADLKNYVNCVAQVMHKYGASQQAIVFAKLFNGRVFMQEFNDTGKVDVIKTTEIAADYSQGIYLVNGQPNVINVTDYNILKKINQNLWLANDNYQVKKLPDGGQSFIFNYEIKPCRACPVSGHMKVEFDFARNGKFLGVGANNYSPLRAPARSAPTRKSAPINFESKQYLVY